MKVQNFPIRLLEVYKSFAVIPKPYYNVDSREKFWEWPEMLLASSGYFSNHTVFLPEQQSLFLDQDQDQVLILTEQNPLESFQQKLNLCHQQHPEFGMPFSASNALISQGAKVVDLEKHNQFELFYLEEVNGELYLYFDYDANAFQLGKPERHNHYLIPLEVDHPVLFLINGAGVSEEAEGRKRVFYEFAYLLNYRGWVDELAFVPSSEIGGWKEIPNPQTVIDERKAVY